jgi:chaperonin GroES
LIKPLNDYVVLKYKKEENKTKSGIILNLDDKIQECIGVVVSCGPKVSDIKNNDEVVYKEYSGTKIKIQGLEYLIIKAEEILALLN